MSHTGEIPSGVTVRGERVRYHFLMRRRSYCIIRGSFIHIGVYLNQFINTFQVLYFALPQVH